MRNWTIINKRAQGGLSIILSMIFIALGGLWVVVGLKPLLEYNLGAIFAPIIFSLVFQLISYYDFKSPLFGIIVGVLSLVSFIFITIGWDYRIMVIGLIADITCYIGMWMDDTKNVPGEVGTYSFLALFIGIIISIILVAIFVL